MQDLYQPCDSVWVGPVGRKALKARFNSVSSKSTDSACSLQWFRGFGLFGGFGFLGLGIGFRGFGVLGFRV